MKDDETVRSLQRTTMAGKPCSSVGSGFITRGANSVESMQLSMAGALLGHASNLLADSRATPTQLRFLLARVNEALRDVHQIAEGRVARIPLPDQAPDGSDGAAAGGCAPHVPAESSE